MMFGELNVSIDGITGWLTDTSDRQLDNQMGEFELLTDAINGGIQTADYFRPGWGLGPIGVASELATGASRVVTVTMNIGPIAGAHEAGRVTSEWGGAWAGAQAGLKAGKTIAHFIPHPAAKIVVIGVGVVGGSLLGAWAGGRTWDKNVQLPQNKTTLPNPSPKPFENEWVDAFYHPSISAPEPQRKPTLSPEYLIASGIGTTNNSNQSDFFNGWDGPSRAELAGTLTQDNNYSAAPRGIGNYNPSGSNSGSGSYYSGWDGPSPAELAGNSTQNDNNNNGSDPTGWTSGGSSYSRSLSDSWNDIGSANSYSPSLTDHWNDIGSAASTPSAPSRTTSGAISRNSQKPTDYESEAYGVTSTPTTQTYSIPESSSTSNKPPLVMDLDGDGVNITPLGSSNFYYDMDGDGQKNRTAWAAAGDGVLVRDAA